MHVDCEIVVNVDSKQNQINLYKTGSKENPKPFTFDKVFASDSLQSVIYEETAFSLVDSVIEGYNGTIFAYGQTGCGKTHTMMGSNDNESNKGIIPRTFSQIITFTNSESEKKHLVQCSFIEIYNE